MGGGLKALIAEALADPAPSVSQADVFADLAAHHARRIAARKAELGLSDDSAHPELSRKRSWGCAPTARNAGQNRTPSKRALLKAIKDAGGEW